MKLIFAGTPEFAAAALQALLAAGHQLPLVLTQPDRPAGRGMKLHASAVKQVALAHGCDVFQPTHLKDPASHAPIKAALAAGAELMVVAAYGLILPQAVLDLPARGCINIHASLLPRWRGAAPIQRAIEAGDDETGITLMQMDAGLDTGAMLTRHAIAIDEQDNAASLHDKLAALGAQAIVEALAQIDQLRPTPQPEQGVTYASKISKNEACLDWQQPAELLARRIRAFNPFPGASTLHEGVSLKLWQAQVATHSASYTAEPGQILAIDSDGILVACGQGVLRLTELQKPGGRRLPAREFLASVKLSPGMRLG